MRVLKIRVGDLVRYGEETGIVMQEGNDHIDGRMYVDLLTSAGYKRVWPGLRTAGTFEILLPVKKEGGENKTLVHSAQQS